MMEIFVEITNGFQLLTIFAKKLYHDCLTWLLYLSVKVSGIPQGGSRIKKVKHLLKKQN